MPAGLQKRSVPVSDRGSGGGAQDDAQQFVVGIFNVVYRCALFCSSSAWSRR
jgi:hypothetical protein